LEKNNKSENEYNLSLELFKRFYGGKFSMELLKRKMEMSKRTLNHFRIDGDLTGLAASGSGYWELRVQAMQIVGRRRYEMPAVR